MRILAQASMTNPVLQWTVGKSSNDSVGILGKFLSGFIGLLLVLGAIWAFVNLLLGALNWISSGGDKAKLEAAQQRIVQAIIGLVLVFAAWAIFFVLLRFLGVTKATGGGLQLMLPKLF